MTIFLVCTVRNASTKQLKAQVKYVESLEAKGHIVHYPPRDTDQALREIQICRRNVDAIKVSDEVHIFYNPNSQGTHFDMGVAFALGKRIVIANELSYGVGPKFERMLHAWRDTYGY